MVCISAVLVFNAFMKVFCLLLNLFEGVADSSISLHPPRDAESTSKHEIRKYIVYETCLMELFDVCAVCKCVCAVKTKRLGTFISVEQLCEYCEYSRIWKSQPLLDNTPAGNLQLSAAVYISGASFFKLQRVNEELVKNNLLHC
jgi:hypothetical protein